jgi:hypothetical protein
MDVVRDVLDEHVVDRNGREMGRVDGVLADVVPDQPLRLAAILIGPAALADRVHPGLGRLVRRIEKHFGLSPNRPAQIEFADVEQMDTALRVRLAIGDTAVADVERRLREWVIRLPGAR